MTWDGQGCPCKVTLSPAQGSHDTVTKEWDPDTPTLHASLERDPSCFHHGEGTLRCYACEISAPGGPPANILNPPQGWSIRCDLKVASCPAHNDLMPPHPKGPETFMAALA